MGGQVGPFEGLLDAEEPEAVQRRELGDAGATGELGVTGQTAGVTGERLVAGPVRAVGVDLEAQVGEGGSDPGDGLDVPTRADLELHPPVALSDQGAHRVQELVGGVGLAHHRSELHQTSLHPQQAGQGPSLGPEVGVGHRHLQGGEGQRRMGGGPADLPELGRRRDEGSAGTGPDGSVGVVEEGRDHAVAEDGDRPFDVLGVEGGVGQCRALAPAVHPPRRLAVGVEGPAHQVDQGDPPGPVGTPGRSHRNPERQLHRPQTDRVQGDAVGAAQSRPPFGQRIGGGAAVHAVSLRSGWCVIGCRRSAPVHPEGKAGGDRLRPHRPGWRNGRRGGLKIHCPKGRAGSNPAPGTHLLTRTATAERSDTGPRPGRRRATGTGAGRTHPSVTRG